MLRAKKTKHTDPTPAPGDETAASSAPPVAPAPAEAPFAASDDVEALKAKAAQMEEWKDKCLRLAADLDNYRKRVAREKVEQAKYATQHLLARLLPAIDSFEAALQHADANQNPDSIKALVEGLKMTLGQIHAVLREVGVEVVNAEGQHFDPQVHEAISHLESEEHPAGKVIQQLRKGYKLSDRLLRPATVVVSKGKPQPAPAPAETPRPADGAAEGAPVES
ncbi:MAG: nucleotide exchange factor GrpE [Verrucomicrobiae bacterium]|nr:nucleotide exchange factor GrpE [Verrucomicrobiae bacterium]